MNHYVHGLSALMNYAHHEGWVTQNPGKGLAIKGVKKRHRRDPFTAAELTKIFKAPLYTAAWTIRVGTRSPDRTGRGGGGSGYR